MRNQDLTCEWGSAGNLDNTVVVRWFGCELRKTDVPYAFVLKYIKSHMYTVYTYYEGLGRWKP